MDLKKWLKDYLYSRSGFNIRRDVSSPSPLKKEFSNDEIERFETCECGEVDDFDEIVGGGRSEGETKFLCEDCVLEELKMD